jgi:DNA-binding MarR family transcriptional regulator
MSEPDMPCDSIGRMVKLISAQMQRKGDAMMKSEGLTLTQMNTMWFIHREGGEVTQKQIEQYLGVSHPTVVGIISRMEKNGFLVSTVDPKDRRGRKIRTTEKADRFRDAARAHKRRGERILSSRLTEDELKELMRMLRIVYENVIRDSEGDAAEF